MTDHVEIVHLTLGPPFAMGSYNRLVGAQMRKITEFRQAAISFWAGEVPDDAKSDRRLIIVNGEGLSPWRKLFLRLPERIRMHWHNGISGRNNLIHAWRVLELLPRLRPKVVVCYDGHKLGRLLRQVIDWPCRLVLSQRGLSYYLEPVRATQIYGLQSFDVVWTLTYASYHFDRHRMPAYEPWVEVLPNCIDTDVFTPVSPSEKQALRARWGIPQAAPVVLLLSRMVPKKGAHLIVSSWTRILKEIPGAVLWIVGSGEASYERYLRGLVEALGLSASVRFQGAAPPELTASCYQAADLYVFPTLFVEGQSRSLLEAMSCALACVVSDHLVARELYGDAEVTFVSNPNVADVFVDPVVRLLREPERRRQIGEAARCAVVERYSEDVMFDRLREFYRRQLSLVGG